MDRPIPTFSSNGLGIARHHFFEGIPPRGTSLKAIISINLTCSGCAQNKGSHSEKIMERQGEMKHGDMGVN
jgi:hypothetical protein